MLASALGLGLFLAGGAVSAQTWVPATSPYGTWRQAVPLSKPVPQSWKEGPGVVAPAASKDSATTVPLPPLPPPAAPVTAPVQETVPLPPPVAPVTAPVQEAAPLPPLPPLPTNQDAKPQPTQTETVVPLPPPAPVSAKEPAVIPVHNEAAEEAEQPARVQQPGVMTIKRAEFQPPIGLMEDRRQGSEDRSLEQKVQLEPPGTERLFRLESEAALNERMRQEGKTLIPAEKINFPEYPPLSSGEYPGRHWPPQAETVEPNYVCHGRLLFEDRNSERFGWDFGILQPVISSTKFFADVVTMPYHIATAPCRCYECSAGLCLPGDPMPYLCYPTELSATGALAEVGAVAGILAVFP